MSIAQPPTRGKSNSRSTNAAGNSRTPRQPSSKQTTKYHTSPANQSAKTAGNRQGTVKAAGKSPVQAQRGPKNHNTPTPTSPPRRRLSPTMLGLAAIGLVVVVLLVFILVGTTGKSAAQKGNALATSTAPAGLVTQVESVPASVFNTVGLPSEISNYPTQVKAGLPTLTSDGLPVLLYMSAEYCPYCAAERWALVMALSKFGTFSGLKLTYSSATDFAADTPTFSFYGSTYTSKYLVFKPYELASNQPAKPGACNVGGYACLDNPPQSDLTLLANKSIFGANAGAFPFMDFANKLYQAGAGFTDQPLVLQGYTHDQIASQLYNPSSSIAQAEDGSANYITAAICAMTNNQPASACSAPYIKTAQQKSGIS